MSIRNIYIIYKYWSDETAGIPYNVMLFIRHPLYYACVIFQIQNETIETAIGVFFLSEFLVKVHHVIIIIIFIVLWSIRSLCADEYKYIHTRTYLYCCIYIYIASYRCTRSLSLITAVIIIYQPCRKGFTLPSTPICVLVWLAFSVAIVVCYYMTHILYNTYTDCRDAINNIMKKRSAAVIRFLFTDEDVNNDKNISINKNYYWRSLVPNAVTCYRYEINIKTKSVTTIIASV